MDDKKCMDMLKKDAQDIEIPESLKPEAIRKKLEEQYREPDGWESADVRLPVSRKKRIPFRRYAAWAAAALLFLVVFAGVVPVLKKTDPSLEKTDSIFHLESYEALYDMIKEGQEEEVFEETAVSMNEDAVLYDTGTEIMMEESAPVMESAGAADTAAAGAVPEAAAEDRDHSTTNTQEEQVDEADIVKTDGTYIYTLAEDGTVRIIEAASLELKGEIPAEGDASSQAVELYVDGDLLQIIRCEQDYRTYQDNLELPNTGGISEAKDSSSETEASAPRAYYSVPVQMTTVSTYDISDRSHPIKKGGYRQDGSYRSSRKNGGYLYLFTSYYPESGPDALAKEYYVPRSGEEYLSYEDIYLPVQKYTGRYQGSAWLVASSIEDSRPAEAADCMAVVSGGETFYVSGENIYTAASDWEDSENKTDLVRFGYKDGIFTPGCSGRIPGTLNDNFSMDEYQGNLRVVTTTDSWKTSENTTLDGNRQIRTNGLYILDMDLKIQGRIENLAEGEEIKSARFLGDQGYFVTYRNTDPLFSVDLSDPQKPEILGELKITGFSEYLHFYGKDRLLGIGWETDPETGEQKGLKCSMFDVSDPKNVREVDRLVLADVFVCDALFNYKAILAEPEKNLFGFAYGIEPRSFAYEENSRGEDYYYGVFSYDQQKGFVPLKYINVSEGKLFEDGMTYPDHRDLRGIYVGSTFYLVSGKGIEAYDMTEDFAWKDVLLWEEQS